MFSWSHYWCGLSIQLFRLAQSLIFGHCVVCWFQRYGCWLISYLFPVVIQWPLKMTAVIITVTVVVIQRCISNLLKLWLFIALIMDLPNYLIYFTSKILHLVKTSTSAVPCVSSLCCILINFTEHHNKRRNNIFKKNTNYFRMTFRYIKSSGGFISIHLHGGR